MDEPFLFAHWLLLIFGRDVAAPEPTQKNQHKENLIRSARVQRRSVIFGINANLRAVRANKKSVERNDENLF
jgi:hypothetical protein